MALDPKVFKAYDIRGIYSWEIDEAGAYAVGRGYLEEFRPDSTAAGRHMCTHSPPQWPRLSCPVGATGVPPRSTSR